MACWFGKSTLVRRVGQDTSSVNWNARSEITWRGIKINTPRFDLKTKFKCTLKPNTTGQNRLHSCIFPPALSMVLKGIPRLCGRFWVLTICRHLKYLARGSCGLVESSPSLSPFPCTASHSVRASRPAVPSSLGEAHQVDINPFPCELF